ncbi:FAD-binding oxidoreductase [Streptomyces griseocarneus]|uniref:FAD-binding oxidoreductase n=1 Tax=Streptomyces griseocarneus TaxID=51201 RepID=UPI00199A0F9E|nr:FAD-binding oxidoreductase [Streptomyces griseocarneus]MBZ6474073.1 FAD-binding oxidoreductase [Streptomyces griseocarneus]GHG51960.1 oxidoreductase [Streptomyces griseocarneus]
MPGRSPAARFEGTLIRRGDRAYDSARAAAVWNGLKPERFPEVIVRAASERDVAEALSYARSEGMRVSTRSGGHNWSGSQLRDGSLLIDLSGLRQCSIAPGTMTATAGPAATGQDLVRALAPYDLAFPVGHCPSVALGGFLLSGGLGWNSRAWGPSCADVLEIRVVTADGRTLTCSEAENADLFWAARGAGPGFFAVVTRFRLGLHPHPGAIVTTGLTFPLSAAGPVAAWAEGVARELPVNVETAFVLTASGEPTATAPPGPRILLAMTAFATTHDEALAALSPAASCPFADSAVLVRAPEPTSFARLHQGADAAWPSAHRYAADTLWSAETYETQLTRMAAAVAHAPSGKSLVLAPVQPVSEDPALLRNMAFSPLGESYLVCYAVWTDPAADGTNARWLRDAMASADPSGRGGRYIAETDLEADASRARRSYAPADWERLQELKAAWDPENVFHSYLAP